MLAERIIRFHGDEALLAPRCGPIDGLLSSRAKVVVLGLIGERVGRLANFSNVTSDLKDASMRPSLWQPQVDLRPSGYEQRVILLMMLRAYGVHTRRRN